MSQHGDPDAQVDEFLELERELSAGSKAAETYEEGNIAEAAKILASDVPDDYPVTIRTPQALQLNVETPDGATVTTYMEWPSEGKNSETHRASNGSGEPREPGTSDHVAQLLDALGRNRDEFANIFGDRVALDTEDGWHRIDAEKTAAMRGAQIASGDDSLDRSRNLLAVALTAAATGFVAINVVSETLGSLLVLISFVAVPLLFYRDAKQLSDASVWEFNRGRLVPMAVPIFNVGLGFAYLSIRRLRLSRTFPGDDSATMTTAFALASAGFLVGITANEAVTNVATPLFLYTAVFLPCLVYFDSEYVAETTDWSPNRGAWCAFAGLTGVVGTGAYLWKRRNELR